MDYQRILSDAAISGIRIVVLLVAGLVKIPLVTKLLGGGAYGIWATVVGIVQILVTVGGLHLSGGFIRYVREETAFVDTLTLLLTSTVIVSVCFSVIGSLVASRPFFPFPSELVVPTSALIGIRILLHYLVNCPRARRRVKLHEALYALQLLAETAVLGVALLVARQLVAGIWALVAVDLLATAVLLAAFLPGELRWPNPAKFRTYLSYSIPMVPKELSQRVLSHGDKVLILSLIGPVAAGVYAAAYGVTSLLSQFGQLFDSTLYPNVSNAWDKGERDEIASLYTTFLRGYAILIVPSVVGITFVGNAVLELIATPAIAARGTGLIPLLAIGFAFQGVEKALSFPLAAAERTVELSTVTLVTVICNLAMNAALIPLFGLVGAAIATSLSFVGRSAYVFVLVDWQLGIQPPYYEICAALVGAGLMALGLTVLPDLSTIHLLVVYPPLGAGIYGVTIVLLGGVSSEDWSRFRGLLFD
jgi:O-antigen/teichoic acid export membrane protein